MSLLKSKLLLPILISLLIVFSIQSGLVLKVIELDIDALNAAIHGRIESAMQNVGQHVDQSNSTITSIVDRMAERANQSLSATLQTSFDQEQSILKESFSEKAQSLTDTIATFMKATAGRSLYYRDSSHLLQYIEAAQNSDHVVFALFAGKDGRIIAEQINWRNPAMKPFLNWRETGPLDINAMLKIEQSNVAIIREDVLWEESVAGQFVIAINNQHLNTELQFLSDRFTALVSDSKAAVNSSIQEETGQLVAHVDSTLGDLTGTLEVVLQGISGAVKKEEAGLMRDLLTVVIGTSVVMLGLIIVLLNVLILKKVNVLRRALWDIAEGDGNLTQRSRIEGNDEIADTAKALDKFIARTQGVVKQVMETVQHTVNATDKLAVNTDRAGKMTDQQQKDVEQVSTSISQLNSSSKQVSENIHNAAVTVEKIKSSSGLAGDVSRKVRSELGQLIKDINHASTVITELDSHSSEIGSVLDVIRGIAEQTNLLALNAAIEAARAGESGRGFAVVADEVRSLASKTQESTSEIQNRIERLQTGAQNAVSAIQRSIANAAGSVESFDESDRHQEGIAQSVAKLFDLSTEVASMAEEQSAVSEEINRKTQSIYDASEQTSDAITQVVASTQDIGTQVDALRQKLGVFKV